MTDLQVKYHSLKETQRANEKQEALRAQENAVKRWEAESKAREATTNEAKQRVAEREQARKEGRERLERANLVVEGVGGIIGSTTQGMANFTKGISNLVGSVANIAKFFA